MNLFKRRVLRKWIISLQEIGSWVSLYAYHVLLGHKLARPGVIYLEFICFKPQVCRTTLRGLVRMSVSSSVLSFIKCVKFGQ